ncbi:MAG: hypothetical protein RL154_1653, partial [Pseudomonadota bacterium]
SIFKAFFIIGATSFGGGVVAYLRDAIVERNGWMSESEFLATLEISQTMPGLNTINISILTGDKLMGVPGAIVAFFGMLVPGCVFVFILGMAYNQNANNPIVLNILAGTASAAVGLLLAVTIKIGKKQFLNLKDSLFMLATFFCVVVLKLHLAELLLILAPAALFAYRPQKDKDAS